MTSGTAAVLVLAGGSGRRVGADRNKVFLPLSGYPVIAWSLASALAVPEVGPVVLVVRPGDEDAAERALRALPGPGPAPGRVELERGGRTRQESELRGLRRLAGRIDAREVDVVLIHDGARPMASPELYVEVIATARAVGGAVPGVTRRDLARVAPDGRLTAAVAEDLVAVQTPQGFRADPLVAAYEQAWREGFEGTDTASCMLRFTDLPIGWVPGDPRNIKITYPHDVLIAQRLRADPGAQPLDGDHMSGGPPRCSGSEVSSAGSPG